MSPLDLKKIFGKFSNLLVTDYFPKVNILCWAPYKVNWPLMSTSGWALRVKQRTVIILKDLLNF